MAIAAIQSTFQKIGAFEDFNGMTSSATLSAGTNTRYEGISIGSVHDTTFTGNVTTGTGGIGSFAVNSAASDGVTLMQSPMLPGKNAPMVLEARFTYSSTSDYRIFIGWQETVSLTAPVIPYTLATTTLTANAAGGVVGFYADSGATTKDFRFMAGTNSSAATTAQTAFQFQNAGTTLGSLGVRAQVTPTASSFHVARVIIFPDGSAEGWFGHTTMPTSDRGLQLICRLKAGVLPATTYFFPVLTLRAGSTGSPTFTADYYGAVGQRDWTA